MEELLEIFFTEDKTEQFFEKIEGKIQPLLFSFENIFPFKINLVPFINLFDYPEKRSAWLNIIGNTTMFIPVGII